MLCLRSAVYDPFYISPLCVLTQALASFPIFTPALFAQGALFHYYSQFRWRHLGIPFLPTMPTCPCYLHSLFASGQDHPRLFTLSPQCVLLGYFVSLSRPSLAFPWRFRFRWGLSLTQPTFDWRPIFLFLPRIHMHFVRILSSIGHSDFFLLFSLISSFCFVFLIVVVFSFRWIAFIFPS